MRALGPRGRNDVVRAAHAAQGAGPSSTLSPPYATQGGYSYLKTLSSSEFMFYVAHNEKTSYPAR